MEEVKSTEVNVVIHPRHPERGMFLVMDDPDGVLPTYHKFFTDQEASEFAHTILRALCEE